MNNYSALPKFFLCWVEEEQVSQKAVRRVAGEVQLSRARARRDGRGGKEASVAAGLLRAEWLPIGLSQALAAQPRIFKQALSIYEVHGQREPIMPMFAPFIKYSS